MAAFLAKSLSGVVRADTSTLFTTPVTPANSCAVFKVAYINASSSEPDEKIPLTFNFLSKLLLFSWISSPTLNPFLSAKIFPSITESLSFSDNHSP